MLTICQFSCTLSNRFSMVFDCKITAKISFFTGSLSFRVIKQISTKQGLLTNGKWDFDKFVCCFLYGKRAGCDILVFVNAGKILLVFLIYWNIVYFVVQGSIRWKSPLLNCWREAWILFWMLSHIQIGHVILWRPQMQRSGKHYTLNIIREFKFAFI